MFAPDVPGEKEGIYVYDGEKGVFEPRTTDDAVKLGNRSASVHYPASEFSVEEGRIVFTMPGAVAPEGETVTAVRLSGSGVNISGRATLSWEGEGRDALPVLTTPDGDPEISLEGSWHLSSDSYREFFFLLPQSGTFSGMTLTVSYGKTEATAAGLAGYVSGSESAIRSCSVLNSTVKGSADYGASGLVGGIYGGRIESCTATEVTIGNSSSASRSNFGGLVNYVNGTVAIDGCTINGMITSEGTIGSNFGGIVGQADAESASLVIINSLSAASVRATGSGNVEAGGVAGRLVNLGSKYAMIYNCAGLNALVESTDAAALRVGSLLGLIYSKKEGNTAGDAARARMYNCYSALDPAGFRVANTEATADIGGLVATIYSNNDIRNDYYLVDDGKVTVTVSGGTFSTGTEDLEPEVWE